MQDLASPSALQPNGLLNLGSLHIFLNLSRNTISRMADSGDRKRKLQEPNSEVKERPAKRGTLPESQQSESMLKPGGDVFEPCENNEIFKSVLATLPPIQQWSSDTIESLRFAVKEKSSKSEWQGESEWTRRAIDAILESNEGWNWQRLKTCSNEDYFSLPTYVSYMIPYSSVLKC